MAGDSFRRQTSMAREYADRTGLELDDKLTFRDLGVSAFRGKPTLLCPQGGVGSEDNRAGQADRKSSP